MQRYEESPTRKPYTARDLRDSGTAETPLENAVYPTAGIHPEKGLEASKSVESTPNIAVK
jgi:hypothetical protein